MLDGSDRRRIEDVEFKTQTTSQIIDTLKNILNQHTEKLAEMELRLNNHSKRLDKGMHEKIRKERLESLLKAKLGIYAGNTVYRTLLDNPDWAKDVASVIDNL